MESPNFQMLPQAKVAPMSKSLFSDACLGRCLLKIRSHQCTCFNAESGFAGKHQHTRRTINHYTFPIPPDDDFSGTDIATDREHFNSTDSAPSRRSVAGSTEMEAWSCWSRWRQGAAAAAAVPDQPEPFSLPSPLPRWPQGGGFANGRICVGELEVVEITKFQIIWSCLSLEQNNKGATFYRPIGIPDGFFSLGHYGQQNEQNLRGFVLAAREIATSRTGPPALQKPLDYKLVWSSNDWKEDNLAGCGYFWLPCSPENYKAAGYVVTNTPDKPSLDEVRCVRSDLTDACESCDLILNLEPVTPDIPIRVWKTRPIHRGIWGKGVPVGTFLCSMYEIFEDELSICCLKNLDSAMHAMPNLEQIHALINHYGPTVFFHPKEIYLPSSVSWFFKQGATLYTTGLVVGESIDSKGSNLPSGGENDGQYWIDLPDDDRNDYVKCGDIESAELYVHVKPALGGTFTDIVMWVFCPFNGPATIKIGVLNLSFKKIGRHVGDWEHFTLRISNFTGELWSVYFSQHSGGEWVDTCNLEFVEGNRPVVYSSKSGHASFPHPGNYLQGSDKLGIGIRNDADRSELFVDSSTRYQIIAAEYLGDIVSEPPWLQYMREWGPTITYNSKSELEKMIRYLPINIRFSVEKVFDKLPLELYGEEGPTGPKQKNNWVGDERW